MWGMRVRDPSDSDQVLFDTTLEETMFFYDEFTIDLPTTSASTRSYPELTNKKIYISEVVEDRYGGFDGHPQQALTLSYPSGIPTITVAAAPAPNPGGAIAYKRIIVMTDGSQNEGGSWGGRFLNGNNRLSISDSSDAYYFLGGYSVVGSGIGETTVDFNCNGTPVIFITMNSPGAVFDGIFKVNSTTWRAHFSGVGSSNTNVFRVFGRMSLNYTTGAAASWGYRQRASDGSGRIVFDSSVRMLALKGYSAQNLVNIGNSPTTFSPGFDISNCSYNGWTYNYRRFERWVRGNVAPGDGMYYWTVTATTYSYTFVAAGSDITWTERLLTQGSGIFIDEYDTSPYEVTYRFPATIAISTVFSFIDNSRYPI